MQLPCFSSELPDHTQWSREACLGGDDQPDVRVRVDGTVALHEDNTLDEDVG